MRGRVDPQSGLFSYFSVEERIAADHPLRRVKAQADAVLGSMGAQFDAMYASGGRPSIAPQRLLKATLLIALYSVRSNRLFCEMLDYNIPFRWFPEGDKKYLLQCVWIWVSCNVFGYGVGYERTACAIAAIPRRAGYTAEAVQSSLEEDDVFLYTFVLPIENVLPSGGSVIARRGATAHVETERCR